MELGIGQGVNQQVKLFTPCSSRSPWLYIYIPTRHGSFGKRSCWPWMSQFETVFQISGGLFPFPWMGWLHFWEAFFFHFLSFPPGDLKKCSEMFFKSCLSSCVHCKRMIWLCDHLKIQDDNNKGNNLKRALQLKKKKKVSYLCITWENEGTWGCGGRSDLPTPLLPAPHLHSGSTAQGNVSCYYLHNTTNVQPNCLQLSCIVGKDRHQVMARNKNVWN